MTRPKSAALSRCRVAPISTDDSLHNAEPIEMDIFELKRNITLLSDRLGKTQDYL